MAKIGTFVGTVYGNALFTAEEVRSVLIRQGHQVTIFEDGSFEQWQAYTDQVILIITSTTGQGCLPENIISLFQKVKTQLEQQISLRYGIIALGNSNYDTFCNAGHMFDIMLQKKGAIRVGDLMQIDALKHPQPSLLACSWAVKWSAMI